MSEVQIVRKVKIKGRWHQYDSCTEPNYSLLSGYVLLGSSKVCRLVLTFPNNVTESVTDTLPYKKKFWKKRPT